MTILARGTTADCSNPLLDVYFTLGPGGPPLNVAVLEYQIHDLTGGTPVQVFPLAPGARQVLDPTQDCPAGARLGTGHFAATWTVPDTEALGTHAITWYYRQTATSAEESFTEEFEVAEIAASPDFGGATVQAFLTRFPHFQGQSPALIQLVLDEALRWMKNPACYLGQFEDAQRYLAAHLLTLNGSSRGSGAQSVAAGSASISFEAAQGGSVSSLGKTNYGVTYRDLLRQNCGPGMRVLC